MPKNSGGRRAPVIDQPRETPRDDSRSRRAASRRLPILSAASPHPHPLIEPLTLSGAHRDRLSPDEIIELMKAGNDRFRRGERAERNYLAEQQASRHGQRPSAIILSCIDSRAPAEVIMDLGIGDVFNTRNAGNAWNDDVLGSMEFACTVAGAKVVVIMGHTSCSAVIGAIDNVRLGHLTGLLNRIRPAIASTPCTGERSSRNIDFVNAVARRHVELTMAEVRQRSDLLRELESRGGIRIAGAMYNLDTATVEFFD